MERDLGRQGMKDKKRERKGGRGRQEEREGFHPPLLINFLSVFLSFATGVIRAFTLKGRRGCWDCCHTGEHGRRAAAQHTHTHTHPSAAFQ